MQRPLLGTQVNWSHPLAQGLSFGYLMNENSGHKIFNFVNPGRHEGTLTQATTFPVWTNGGIKFGAGDPFIDIPYHLDVRPPIFSVATAVQSDTPSVSWQGIAVHANSGWSNGWGLYQHAGSRFHFFINGYTAGDAWDEYDGSGINHLVGTYDGSNVLIYQNGKIGIIKDTNVYDSFATENLVIGADATYNFAGTMYYFYFYNRILTSMDSYWLSREPFAMFDYFSIAQILAGAQGVSALTIDVSNGLNAAQGLD